MLKKICIAACTSAVALTMFSSTLFAAKTQPKSSGLPPDLVYVPPTNPQKQTWGDRLILYIPNRALDFLDMADLSLGIGPVAKAKVWGTRYFAFGGGFGGTAKLVKAYNRQYGAGFESGWSVSFAMISAENDSIYDTTRDVQKYFYYNTGLPNLDDRVYNFWTGPRDIFSIGVEGAVLVEVDAEIHPFEIFDFFAGLIFLDPKHDDITMQDIKS